MQSCLVYHRAQLRDPFSFTFLEYYWDFWGGFLILFDIFIQMILSFFFPTFWLNSSVTVICIYYYLWHLSHWKQLRIFLNVNNKSFHSFISKTRTKVSVFLSPGLLEERRWRHILHRSELHLFHISGGRLKTPPGLINLAFMTIRVSFMLCLWGVFGNESSDPKNDARQCREEWWKRFMTQKIERKKKKKDRLSDSDPWLLAIARPDSLF